MWALKAANMAGQFSLVESINNLAEYRGEKIGQTWFSAFLRAPQSYKKELFARFLVVKDLGNKHNLCQGTLENMFSFYEPQLGSPSKPAHFISPFGVLIWSIFKMKAPIHWRIWKCRILVFVIATITVVLRFSIAGALMRGLPPAIARQKINRKLSCMELTV